MRTNVLNDLSSVVKKGAGLACSWSQVGRMSEGAPDEHPMSIRSASDGERWKPAGEKGSTRVWKHVAMIFAVLVMSIANIGMAWGADISNYAHGWEDNSTSQYTNDNATLSISSEARTGTKSMQTYYNGTGDRRIETKATFAIPNGSTMYAIGYAKLLSSDATTPSSSTQAYLDAYVGGGSTHNTIKVSTTWQRMTSYKKAGSAQTGKTLRLQRKHAGKGNILFDDIVIYVSTDTKIDLKKPGSATSASATTSSISWTCGTDVGDSDNGATGIQATLIFHRTGGSVGGNDLTLNDQGIYSLTSTEGPSTDQSGKWTLLSASVGAAATSYSGTFEAGHEYAIVHRDLAYNYSTPTYVTVPAAACGETAQAALTLSSSSGTICGTGTATFTVSGGSGTGELSVSSSDETKATASIDGTTVTVTGVAAGSATITVTKACDATYAEKTATYSATVAAVPTANAGADKVTEPGTGVALAATAAADGCTGAWTIQSGPNTSTAQLSSTSSATATFTPTIAGTYTLRWTVTNTSSSCSAYDEMTVSAAVCSISECGNATITYAINGGSSGDHSEGGADLISSATASNTTALGASTTVGYTGISMSSLAKKAAAATSACYPTKPNMSGKIGVYNGAAYNSSNYLQFAFTVKTGYTFTPCDIEFTVQPVDVATNYRWEVTDGTNVYGYGTATYVPKGSDGGASVLTGLTSTAEMEAGTYYIRLYPYVNAASKTFRISNNVILKGTTASAAPSCTAPSSVTVAATNANGWRYTIGETIDLTATATGGSGGSYTYQWQKYIDSDWEDIDGANNARFQKASCTSSDGGQYRCVVSTGATCSLASDGFNVRVWTLNGNYSGSGFTENAITWTGANTGTATVTLNANSTYEFKVYGNGDGKYYGCNSGISSDISDWTFRTNEGNCALTTGALGGGEYTFAINISNAGENNITVSVTYPRKTIHVLPNGYTTASAKLSIYYWRGGTNGWSSFLSSDECGAYSTNIPGWAETFSIVRLNSDATAGSWDKKWNQTVDITANASYNQYEVNTWCSGDGCKESVTAGTYSIPTYTISYNAGTGGSGTKADESKTCGVAFTLPNSAVFTRTGYTQTGWTTSDGGAQEYALGGTYTTNEDKTFYPVWSCITPEAPAAAKITATDGCSGSAGATFSADDSGKPSYVTWYWQTASDGTSTSYPVSSDYETASTAGSKTMYVRAKNTACDTWSTATSKSATVKTAATIAWNTAPADGTAGGSMTASVTSNYSAGVAYAVTSASPAGCVTVGASTGVISYVAAGTATIRATVTGAGDYCSSAYVDQAITVTAAAVLTAISADVLYQAADMANITFTGNDQYWAGLSTNNLFQTYGNGTSNSAKGKTISSTSVTDDISTKNFTSHAYIEGSDVTSGTADPTYGAIEFITPSTAGILYVYTVDGSSSNLKLRKKGSSTFTALTGSSNYNAIAVDANSNYYIHGNASKRGIYGIKYVSTYAVSITTTNVTKATGEATAIKGKAYTATFTANTGYTLPSDATVTIGGTPQTKGTGYTWTISAGTATLTIPAANVTGDIAVSVAGVAATTYDVDFSLTNVAYSSGDNEGTDAATEGVEFSTIFAASSGYSLPGTITVTIGGVAQTAGTGYTWAQGSGTLTIPAAYVTGDIVVTIVGEEMEGDGCDELVHTEAATATTLTTTVGSATLTNPSGQTANDKAIKLNSSGYIELSPKAGKSFAAGDSLIIVMWNQASSAKTTGYRIAGTDYTASMPSKVNTTFRRKLIAADIVSSKVKIERESDNGSNAYFVSAIIKHCEDLPSCTTPTLPTLSKQTVCPGSDIAAWDATPTNIATITGASEDVAYSWKKKGSDTELVATASFDLGSSATESQAGTYVVTVTVSKTGYISKSASAEVDLTVTPATETPSITASKAKVYATDEVTLTATCGSTGVTWNWYLCANADGTGAGSSLGTSATYTIASAPAAGTYYYKAVATGDGTHSCGTAEYVYTLVVSAANSCDKEFWFAKEGDRPTGAAAATHITGCPSGSSSASYTASVDGTNYTLTGSTGQKTGDVTIVVPADNTGTLYVVVQGSSSRTITLSKGGTQIGQETPENSTWGVFTFDDLDAGTYNLVSSGNISWAMMALKLCPTVACTDDTPTAAATNATVCAGGTITITATGYETGATFQWQKQNASTSVWENIDGATSDTYTVTTAAAEHAGNYHIVATKGCARTSNTVTIAVPSAPVFNSFTTTRRIMETQALSISDVSATDAVSYTWYKSADATWDAGDEVIGTSRSLLKPYDGETAGSTYYVICRAANSCGTTTSTAITVTVQTLIEEDCAIAGNSGEHNTFAKTGNVSSGTYGSIAELHTNSNNKYIYYTAESGYYFATATVNACVGNASDLPTAAYSYSTDGGANWTDQNLTGMTAAYADHVINLPANVNAFRVGRRLGDCGTSSNTIYIHEVCFTYNENCTKTTVDPSSSSESYEIGDSFTEPTFAVKSSGAALSPQPTITYTSSDETVATVDDDGSVNFQDKAGTVVITASYAGDATYCESEGSYTITVSCSDEAPKVIAADGTNIGGCNDNITLEAKKQDGTTNFSDGTYQWYRDGEAISGATGRTYTASQAGIYTVERTSVGGCVSPSSNKATVTSESAEPEVERLTPFQYYHVDKVYAETSIMRFRHLFAVKNAGTTLEGKHFKMELSRNGGAASDVTNSNAFVMSADTVLLDMNKLYDKYEEDDELVLTCSAVDCEGNVSSIYKNTITIYVIDETPTLALICSGANGDGTRSTKNLVVGGDFLTGYNKADLCVQTGNTSFDKTQEWVLYTRLKENYIVTPVNGYAEFNKLNYEPFDILFLTDYPKASKSDAAATILDDMADLCDYRPLFTFKTHMVAKSPSKWAAKGFMAQPEVPKQSRLRLNIVCYAHPMFDDLKEVSDHIQKDASDHSQIVYTMLTGAGHEGGKGMQGFPIDAAEGFVTIGLVHYDATATDDTPSDGYVTWTSGSSDVMMVAAAERQVNLEARMILFSINCGAQSKLTETGRQVVLKSLEYLLSDATITPVADCSFTFTNGEGNSMSASEYASKCPACTGYKGDGKWSTAANWGPDWILQPGKDTEVKIAAPVTVDMPHAKVRTVRILEGGSIDIPAGSGLEVGSTIRRLDGTELSPTEVVDLSIGSTSSGNGTLIFNNNAGDTKAGVAMYSKGFIDYTDPSKPKGIKNYQYIGVPCVNINAAYNYYGSWIYSWSDKGGSYGWQKVVNGGIVTTWTGYCITQESAGTYYAISGTLAATNTVDIDVPAGENMVVGNSWTAPIYIKEFTDDDFENLEGNVYFFNTGVDKSGDAGTAETRYQNSTYVTVPIHSSPYTGDSLISSMQGFFVKSNGSAGALHLDYDRHVRPSTNRNILSGEMHAPRRANAQSDEPAVLKIKVSGENYDDKLLLLAREDFSMGFDNGWDGDKWDGNESALYIYTKDEEGTENSVSALPEMEGTVIGFRAGEDDAYTLHFEYLNSAEELYLFDTETNAYTKIMTGATYRFFTEDKEKHDRFVITRKSPQIATDVDEVDSGKRREVRKLLIEDKMYILVNGMLYDATGKVVK